MGTLKEILIWIIIVVVIFTIFVASLIYINNQYRFVPQILPENSIGSIIQSQEYSATTTPWDAGWTTQSLKIGRGSLGSVIITKAGDNFEFLLMDATSTPNTETNPISTTTQTLVKFPIGAAAGTYIIDAEFDYGLLLRVLEGNNGTSTITYR